MPLNARQIWVLDNTLGEDIQFGPFHHSKMDPNQILVICCHKKLHPTHFCQVCSINKIPSYHISHVVHKVTTWLRQMFGKENLFWKTLRKRKVLPTHPTHQPTQPTQFLHTLWLLTVSDLVCNCHPRKAHTITH